MAQMDFGVGVHPTPRGGTVPAMLAMNERLLAAATEHDLSCWVIDHFQFDAQPVLECYAFLAYHAGKYPGLRWGNLVLGQGYRNPALTAKIAASLQFLTGGRYILGIGAGWKEDEYRAYGYDFPSARVRIGQLEDAVRDLQAALDRRPRLLHGRVLPDHGCLLHARPGTAAAHHDRRRGRAAHPPRRRRSTRTGGTRTTTRPPTTPANSPSSATIAAPLAATEDAIVPTCYMGVSVSHDPSKLIRRPPVMGRPDMYVISGNPDEVTEQIEEFAAIGVRHMQTQLPRLPPHRRPRLFLSNVLPRFTRAGT